MKCIVLIFVRYIRWFEDISLKGPVVVCSAVSPVSNKEVSDVMTKCKLDKSAIENIDFCSGNIQGRAYVSDCITYNEYIREFDHPVFGEGDFVLIFSSFEPLTIPVPYIPPAPFFQLEKEMLHVLGNVFGS
ncbi:hypothetical protein OESDEN_01334 [Oesophagostomum dentatum]|uniref:Uncharacterized protein n=1 Tax=Oesophagostomum dentatum TaxID=61180 RepID=A0A0B1TS99_OESDE|nr:hypothetical protein OESDEN_01334 [Oesophagostomum dentatum]